MVSRIEVNQMVTAIVLSLVLASGSASEIEDAHCRQEFGWGFHNDRAFRFLPLGFFEQLPRVVFGCIKEADLVVTIERLSRASNSVWWDAFLVHLHYADFGPVEGLDQAYLASLAPEEPGHAGLYALVMQRVTDAPDFWRTELSRIVRAHPEVVGQIRTGDASLYLDMAFLSDWIVEQDQAYLDLFVARVAWEYLVELAELVRPDQLSPATFLRVFGRVLDERQEPPKGWLTYFEQNLGDWFLMALPEEVRDVAEWDLQHASLLRRNTPMQDALSHAFNAMGPLMMMSYVPHFLDHDSPTVRRIGFILRLELVPSLAHFEQVIDSGVTPALLAHEASWEMIEAVVRSGLEAGDSTNLVAFVEHLDCDSLRRLTGSWLVPDRGETPLTAALEAGVDRCLE